MRKEKSLSLPLFSPGLRRAIGTNIPVINASLSERLAERLGVHRQGEEEEDSEEESHGAEERLRNNQRKCQPPKKG